MDKQNIVIEIIISFLSDFYLILLPTEIKHTVGLVIVSLYSIYMCAMYIYIFTKNR